VLLFFFRFFLFSRRLGWGLCLRGISLNFVVPKPPSPFFRIMGKKQLKCQKRAQKEKVRKKCKKRCAERKFYYFCCLHFNNYIFKMRDSRAEGNNNNNNSTKKAANKNKVIHKVTMAMGKKLQIQCCWAVK